MKRVVVIGCSCSGKSTFFKSLASALNCKYIELDALHWLPDWVERDVGDFWKLVEQDTEADEWVVDGNYSVVKDIVWSKATTIIWLNYSFPLVFYRALTRSIKRAVTKEELFSGNSESFRRTFFSKDSILLWVIQTHKEKRKKLPAILLREVEKGVQVVELRNRKATTSFLEKHR